MTWNMGAPVKYGRSGSPIGISTSGDFNSKFCFWRPPAWIQGAQKLTDSIPKMENIHQCTKYHPSPTESNWHGLWTDKQSQWHTYTGKQMKQWLSLFRQSKGSRQHTHTDNSRCQLIQQTPICSLFVLLQCSCFGLNTISVLSKNWL